jgi:hypothetical protein
MMPPEIAIRNSEYLRLLAYEEAQFADAIPKYTNLFIYLFVIPNISSFEDSGLISLYIRYINLVTHTIYALALN